MEYRNAGNATHPSNGLAVGVGSSAGVELGGGSTAGTITAIGDGTNENLRITAKGAGNLSVGDSSNVLYLNGSTTAFKLVCGVSSFRPPDLAANSQGECTFVATGISTGDLIIDVDFRNHLTTNYLPGGNGYVGAANKIHVPVGRVQASTISGSSGVVRWAYIDRT